MREKYKQLFVILGLVITVVAVFGQVRSFEFISYDDNRYVIENQHVRTGLTIDNIIWAFTSPHFFMWHPATSLSHMLDCELFGLNSGRHHLTNLAIHIANTLLLFEILRRMTNHFWASAFVAAVFALHPLNVESIAWVAERKNVLSGFFWMLTIAAYIRYVKCQRISNYLMVIFVFSLALISKPTTVSLPFALLLLDYWPLDRLQRSIPNESKLPPQFKKLSPWHLVKEKTPLFVLSAVLCVITFVTQESGDILSLNRQFPFSLRLANALVSYVTYISKMIFPIHLSVFYPHPGFSLPLWKPIASFILLAVVSIGVLYFSRLKPYLIAGWLWFLGTLIPVIGLIQAGGQGMANRYCYIPLVGLFIIIAWGINDLLINWKYRKIVVGASAITVVLVLSICTYVQTCYWRNSLSLFDYAVKVTRENDVAYNIRGIVYYEKGEHDLAICDYNHALKINPAYTEAYYNLGNAYSYGKGMLDNAIADYGKALEINPSYVWAYNNRGNAYKSKGEYNLAISDYNKSIELSPKFADAYYNRGTAYAQGRGEYDLALADYNKAIELNPGYAEAYCNRGNVYYSKGLRDLALADYNRAIEINPKLADAYINKASFYEDVGLKKEAAEVYNVLIENAPAHYKSEIERARQKIRELEQ